VQQGKVEGGATNASAVVSFDRPSYKANEDGELLILHQEDYLKGLEMTRFGGAANPSMEPIKLIGSDVEGLPAEVPFGTKRVHFKAKHPGQARVAVSMPGSVPPSRIANPGKDEVLKQANKSYENWLKLFTK
jgi:hypothetical protein